MLQCLEWEPSFFYQKHPVEPNENGAAIDHSGASGIIDINLATDITDPSLPPNPKKAILYRPSVTHLIAVSFNLFMKFFLLKLHCKVSIYSICSLFSLFQ